LEPLDAKSAATEIDMKTLSFFNHLLGMILASQWKDRYVFLSLSTVMIIQNFIFFSIWVIFFDAFGEIRDWKLEEMATLFGTLAFGFGLAFVVFGGAIDIGRIIREGELDAYLGRPKAPLLPVLMREARPAGLGDFLSGIMLWLTFGGHSFSDLPLLMFVGVLTGVIVLAVAISVQSVIFYVASVRTLPDQIFELFIIGSSYPQHGHGPLLRLALFTIVPAGFAAYLPVLIVTDFEIWKLVTMFLAALFYMSLAVRIFYRGLKRYSSGNGWIAPA
jgi:viologen exporter family transport system permease protein